MKTRKRFRLSAKAIPYFVELIFMYYQAKVFTVTRRAQDISRVYATFATRFIRMAGKYARESKIVDQNARKARWNKRPPPALLILTIN